jgi:hypothetical protein
MQTIVATRGSEKIRFVLNYRTARARISSATGAERTTLEAAMERLHQLPEQGWIVQ